MQEEVSVHAHIVERIHAGVEQVAGTQFKHDALARQHCDQVGHYACASVQSAIESVMLLLVQFVVNED